MYSGGKNPPRHCIRLDGWKTTVTCPHDTRADAQPPFVWCTQRPFALFPFTLRQYEGIERVQGKKAVPAGDAAEPPTLVVHPAGHGVRLAGARLAVGQHAAVKALQAAQRMRSETLCRTRRHVELVSSRRGRGMRAHPCDILHQLGHTVLVDLVGGVAGAEVVVKGEGVVRLGVVALERLRVRRLQDHLAGGLVKGDAIAVAVGALLVVEGADLGAQ